MQIAQKLILVPVKEFEREVPFSGPHRVVGIRQDLGLASLISLDSKKVTAPFTVTVQELQQLIDEKKVREGNLLVPGYMLQPPADEQSENLFAARYKLLKPFLDDKDYSWLFDDDYRGRLVSQQMVNSCRPRVAVLRWLYHYLRYGMFLGSLYCGYSSRGGYGKRKKVGEKKRGRPPNAVSTGHSPSKTGLNITEGMRQIFRVFKDLYYENRNGRRIAYVREKVIEAQIQLLKFKKMGLKKTSLLRMSRPCDDSHTGTSRMVIFL